MMKSEREQEMVLFVDCIKLLVMIEQLSIALQNVDQIGQSYSRMDKSQESKNRIQKQKDVTRAYGCPCGKTYLSYPALFTHVKQKHEGKPPGKLIKPKTGKIRGRPKTRNKGQGEKVEENQEIHQITSRIQHNIPQLIEDQFIKYEGRFQRSDGSTTCQDVASLFLDHFEGVGENGVAVLSCFVNEVKSAVDERFGNQYWVSEGPAEIIEIANDLYFQHEQKQKIFPIHKDTFKELIYNYFQWLYANKFTDHRLFKKSLSQEGTKTQQ